MTLLSFESGKSLTFYCSSLVCSKGESYREVFSKTITRSVWTWTIRQYRSSQPNCRCSNTRENRNSCFCAPRLDHEPTLARPASLLFRSRAFRQFSYGEHCLGLKSTSFRHWQKSLLPTRANIKRLR